MTTVIQIGTKSVDYIINYFGICDRIQTDLKEILESPTIIKYVFGCDNDVLWLKRDFNIQLVGAMDVQILFGYILNAGLLDQLASLVPFSHYKDWYKENIGPRTNTTTKQQCERWELDFAKSRCKFDKLALLFFKELEIDKDAQLADFRPRKTPQYDKLLKYALDDVHVLFHIVSIMQSVVRKICTYEFVK